MSDGTILAVDNDELTLGVIRDALQDAGFAIVTAENGKQALDILMAEPEKFDAVVIDRMMPVMDGMAFLSAVRQKDETDAIPIVMQTAEQRSQAMREGIEAGAFYYITKPYDDSTLVAIVRSAVQSHNQHKFFTSYQAVPLEAPRMLETARFRFSTFQEAKSVIWAICQHASEPEWVSAGLQALVINAIEHGNLGVGGPVKDSLIRQNRWEAEIERRLKLPENLGKTVIVDFDATGKDVKVSIEDQGTGFDWSSYFTDDFSLENKIQGRGIIVSRSSSAFNSFTYSEGGRRVDITFAKAHA